MNPIEKAEAGEQEYARMVLVQGQELANRGVYKRHAELLYPDVPAGLIPQHVELGCGQGRLIVELIRRWRERGAQAFSVFAVERNSHLAEATVAHLRDELGDSVALHSHIKRPGWTPLPTGGVTREFSQDPALMAAVPQAGGQQVFVLQDDYTRGRIVRGTMLANLGHEHPATLSFASPGISTDMHLEQASRERATPGSMSLRDIQNKAFLWYAANVKDGGRLLLSTDTGSPYPREQLERVIQRDTWRLLEQQGVGQLAQMYRDERVEVMDVNMNEIRAISGIGVYETQQPGTTWLANFALRRDVNIPPPAPVLNFGTFTINSTDIR